MPIVFISSLPFGGGERLARRAAERLGYPFLNREEVMAKAAEYDIPVGKLEVAIARKGSLSRPMALLKKRYLAVATSLICEKAEGGNLVYYGRAGHHLLPGVSHVVRVHILPDPVRRIETAAERIKLSSEKTREFLAEVDADIQAWVRFVHGSRMDDPSRYDYVINLERTGLEGAATLVCAVAALPDHQPTPRSLGVVEDRLLRARAQLRLALSDRAFPPDLLVRVCHGRVTVSGPTLTPEVGRRVRELLADLPRCKGVRWVQAGNNLLWIQRRFDPDSPDFQAVVRTAERRKASLELLQVDAEEAAGEEPRLSKGGEGERESGGLDRCFEDEPALEPAVEFLSRRSLLAGARVLRGDVHRLSEVVSPDFPYDGVIVGDLAPGKSLAARSRLHLQVALVLDRLLPVPRFTPKEWHAAEGTAVGRMLRPILRKTGPRS